MDRPNILWICTDQQRADTLGCYGNTWTQTPNIDRLAARGALFERAFCQNPLCTPSRSSFLTGRYPRTTRNRQNGQSLPPDEVLVTKLLADGGYECGLAGKLHLSAAHPNVASVRERRIDDGYTTFHWSHHPDRDWATADYNQWLASQGLSYTRTPFRGSAHVQTSMAAPYHQTTWCADRAIEFMEARADGSQPWLFSVNIYDPHHPFDPPMEYLQRYSDRLDEIPLPNYVPGELDDKPVFQRIDHGGAYGGQRDFYAFDRMTPQDHRLIRAAYWAMCDLIDAQVGRMLDALERTGQRENTLVVFMSDHGEMLGDHGIYLKGPHFYEPAVRMPLIVSQPGAVQAGRWKALVEFVDLAPTLLEAAGLQRYAGMQGRSLWPLLTGGAGADRHRDDVYCEHYGTTYPEPGAHSAYATMLRTDRHKLTIFHGTEDGELYDLRHDACETHNLWRDPASQRVKLELTLRLCDRMAWTVDPLPQRESPF